MSVAAALGCQGLIFFVVGVVTAFVTSDSSINKIVKYGPWVGVGIIALAILAWSAAIWTAVFL